ncbi:hypothetical protein [Aestuariivirga sp.]|jgi:hypothetical protein|uniref:hypothetical protein n=1 Tax=Aestuariivirga sp. TaxID=2650926 RepID=UPI0037843C8D
MADKLTDILTYVLSAALAISVIAFAAYKIVVLNRMEDPPANLGLNFPPAKRKIITDIPPESDPITTRSLGRSLTTRGLPPQPTVNAVTAGQHVYELLTVVDGVAFVTVESSDDKMLVPVSIGTKLPGGLRVESISQRDGRWQLIAGSLVLSQGSATAQ